jgi:glucose/arabinose dehydrogenase
MLVTERAGRPRIIRDGVLGPKPFCGLPEVYAKQLSGLMDIALDPKFSENKLVYLTYIKPAGDKVTTALARGRWDGAVLADVRPMERHRRTILSSAAQVTNPKSFPWAIATP